MAPDAQTTDWQPPEGFTLTVVPGHYIDRKGFAGVAPAAEPMPNGSLEVPHFVTSEPFVWKINDGTGPMASIEAKMAVLNGEPLAGWSPNCVHLPIQDGWVPDQYVLTWDDDPTPVVEPAEVLPRELTPAEQIDRHQATIDYAMAQIRELKGAAS